VQAVTKLESEPEPKLSESRAGAEADTNSFGSATLLFGYGTEKDIFLSLIVFGGPEAPFLYLFSSAAPQRTAYMEVPSQMAAHPRIYSSL
jgi:hypothetical protein